MAEHYARTQAMRLTIIRGELSAFKVAAESIAKSEFPDTLPASWRPRADALQQVARQASHAVDLEAATSAMGELGTSCAACHQELGGPKLAIEQAPPPSIDVGRHMLRHQWAADRLWDGLIAPSEKAWVTGAEAMAEAPLLAENVAPATPELSEVERSLHVQANQARLLGPEKWGEAYASFLGTCYACHDKSGVTVRPPER